MKVIICDIQVKLHGHYLGHIQNIIRFIEQNPSDTEYIFLLNPEAQVIPSLKTGAKNIKMLFFTEQEFAPIVSGMSMARATQLLWKSILNYIEHHQADRLTLMMLDMFQHTIITSRPSCDITGILFLPYPRLTASENTIQAKLKVRFTKMRKVAMCFAMCRNPRLKKIFIFNDRPTIQQMNNTLKTNIVTYLPDPVFNYPAKIGLDIRKKHSIANEKKIFLAFGMIDEKKNVVNFLKAFQDLSEEEAQKCAFLIVGKIHTSYEEKLAKALEEVRKYQPKLQIILESRFVADEEMECYVGQSDVISLAYINFYASSGVIGLACRHNKPIIASSFGVIGNIAKEYELGIAVDSYKYIEIKKAIQYFLTNTSSFPKRATDFVKNHSGEKFIRTLLEV